MIHRSSTILRVLFFLVVISFAFLLSGGDRAYSQTCSGSGTMYFSEHVCTFSYDEFGRKVYGCGLDYYTSTSNCFNFSGECKRVSNHNN